MGWNQCNQWKWLTRVIIAISTLSVMRALRPGELGARGGVIADARVDGASNFHPSRAVLAPLVDRGVESHLMASLASLA